MHYHFDTDEAQHYGVDAAVMIECLRFWIATNAGNDRGRFASASTGDLHTWTYNSVAAWSSLFPFWTPKQVRRILDKLRAAGVLLAEKHGGAGDQTLYYAFRCEALFLADYHLPKRATRNDQTVEALAPSGKSTISTVNGTSLVEEGEAQFLRIWETYGVKRDRLKAVRSFARLTKANRDKLEAALPAYVARTTAPGSRRIEGQPTRKYLTTYINGENWNDDFTPKPESRRSPRRRGARR